MSDSRSTSHHDNSIHETGSRLINEQAEFEDMNEDGKQAYRAYKRRKHRLHGAIVFVCTVATIVGLTAGPFWLVFSAAFAVESLTILFQSGPDIAALSRGRLAEHEPPEQLSWEEHVNFPSLVARGGSHSLC